MVDYSKWKDIEVSDDEDDTHPNIDTPSLFRWRHQARVERMADLEKEKQELDAKNKMTKQQIEDAKKKLTKPEGDRDVEPIREKLEDLLKEDELLTKKAKEIEKKEKLQPWNVDTISKDGFSKTVLNKHQAAPSDANLTEEEKEAKQLEFINKNEPLLKKYGMLQKYDDSKRFLTEHPHLVCEGTANYLVIWCVNLAVEEKKELMEHVAHQCICMQYILELAKQLEVDPRSCISSFFTRIQVADKQYKDAFCDELRGFKTRINQHAQKRIQRAIEEAEEEERQKRLGPGGLDPVEVFESLPNILKKCFEEKDIPMLQKVISEMPEEEAKYHIKRCVDSGMWVPDGGVTSQAEDQQPEAEEETYAEPAAC